MDIDYVVDKNGNKHKVHTSVSYGAVITTAISPEMIPIDVQSIDRNGYASSRLRDGQYENMFVVDEQRIVAAMYAIDCGLLLPGVNTIYSLVHHSNQKALKRNKLFEHEEVVCNEVISNGEKYGKIEISVDTLRRLSDRLKDKGVIYG